MLILWIFMLVMMLIAIGFILYPTYKERRARHQSGININFYQQRLKELERDFQQGLINEQVFQQYRQELEEGLVKNLPAQANKVERAIKLQDIQTTIFLLLVIPFFATLFYHFWGHSAQIANWYQQERAEKRMEQEIQKLGSHQHITQKFKDIVLTHPTDPQAWYLLGRLYAAEGHFALAESAFAKAYELMPNDLNIMLNYAQAQAWINDNLLTPKSMSLLHSVLRSEPANPIAVNLIAIDYYRRGQFRQAKSYWQALLPYFPNEGEDRTLLLKSIAMADTKLETPGSTANMQPLNLPVHIEISNSLRIHLTGAQQVTVYALPLHGPQLPIALTRKTLINLPCTLILTERMALVPNTNLFEYRYIRVYARVVPHGRTMPHPGDLQGVSTVIDLNAPNAHATVLINSIR